MVPQCIKHVKLSPEENQETWTSIEDFIWKYQYIPQLVAIYNPADTHIEPGQIQFSQVSPQVKIIWSDGSFSQKLVTYTVRVLPENSCFQVYHGLVCHLDVKEGPLPLPHSWLAVHLTARWASPKDPSTHKSIGHEAGRIRSIFWVRNSPTAEVCILPSVFIGVILKHPFFGGFSLGDFIIIVGVVWVTTTSRQNGESALGMTVISILSAFLAVMQLNSC